MNKNNEFNEPKTENTHRIIQTCSMCDKPSAYFQKISGTHYCKKHFIRYIERKIHKTITRFHLIQPNDIIAMGISAGKDSLTMLYNIYEKIKRIPDANQIIAINIDEGISKNEEKQIKYIEEFLDNFGIDVKLIKLSFKNDFGHSLDELVSIFKQKRINLNPCSICATIRRRLLNDTAKKMNATKLAIGHNLDDIAQTLLLNILRNDVRKIGINPPHASIQYENPANNQNEYHLVPRIKPLIFLKDEEIMHYVTFKGFPVYNKPCFYSLNTPILRKKVQLFLNDLELRNAEIKFNLIKANYNLFNIINQSLNENEDKNEDKNANKNANKNEDKNTNKNKSKKEKSNELNYNRCKVCGQPAGSNRDLCLFCWFKKVLGEL